MTRKKGSPAAQSLILVALAILAIPVYFVTSKTAYAYTSANFYFFAIVIACWTVPVLRGQNIGYPLRAISAIWFVIYGLGPQTFLWDDRANAIAIVYAGSLGLLTLCFGYIVGLHLSAARLRPLPPRLIINSDSMYRRIAVILGISIVATIIFVTVGGVPILHSDALNYRFEVRSRVSSYVIFLLRSGQLPLFFVWAAFLLRHIPKTRRNKWAIIIFIGLTLFVNAIPGWRNPLMSIAMTLLFIYMFSRRKVNSLVVGIYGSLSVFLVLLAGYWRLVTFADTQRSATMTWFRTHGSGGSFDIFTQFVSSQFSSYSFGFLTALETFPQKVPYLYGSVLFTTLGTMLPGKQELLDEKLKRWSGSNFEGGGLNLSLLGESYADFGWLGVAMYSSIYGFVLGYLIVKMEHVRTPARVVVTAYMTSSICLGSLTGLLSLSQFWVLGAVAVWIALGERWFASGPARRPIVQAPRPGAKSANWRGPPKPAPALSR